MSFVVGSGKLLNVFEIIGSSSKKILFVVNCDGVKFFRELDFVELITYELDNKQFLNISHNDDNNIYSIGDIELLCKFIRMEKFRTITFDGKYFKLSNQMNYKINIEKNECPLFPPLDECIEIPIDYKIFQHFVNYSTPGQNELTLTLKQNELELETSNMNCVVPLDFDEGVEESSIVITMMTLFREICTKDITKVCKIKINPSVAFSIRFNDNLTYYCVHN